MQQQSTVIVKEKYDCVAFINNDVDEINEFQSDGVSSFNADDEESGEHGDGP